MHYPLWMESKVDYFLCRWRCSQGGSGEGMKINIKCEDCNEALYFTPNRNFFDEFTICRVFLFIPGAFGRMVVCNVYCKSRPINGPKSGYRKRDSPIGCEGVIGCHWESD